MISEYQLGNDKLNNDHPQFERGKSVAQQKQRVD